MKKLLIFLLATSLITACNNKAKTTTTRDKDDYSKQDSTKGDKDKDKDKDNTSNKDNNNNNSSNNQDNTNSNSGASWSSAEVDAFVTNCVSTAVGGGMQQSKADTYCTCMQRKFETLYPNVNDAGKLTAEDMNSPSMQRLVKDCLY